MACSELPAKRSMAVAWADSPAASPAPAVATPMGLVAKSPTAVTRLYPFLAKEVGTESVGSITFSGRNFLTIPLDNSALALGINPFGLSGSKVVPSSLNSEGSAALATSPTAVVIPPMLAALDSASPIVFGGANRSALTLSQVVGFCLSCGPSLNRLNSFLDSFWVGGRSPSMVITIPEALSVI